MKDPPSQIMVFSEKMFAEDVIIKTEVETTTYAHENDDSYKNVKLEETAEASQFDHNEVLCNTEPIHNKESEVKTEISIEDESTCSSCGQTFSKFSEVLEHNCSKKDQTKPHTCQVFKTPVSDVKSHCYNNEVFCKTEPNHDKESDTEIEICVKEEIDKNRCNLCRQTFSNNSELLEHSCTNKKPKYQRTPHTCQICRKVFKQFAHLKRHAAVHTGEKKYVCEVCERPFSDSSAMRRHFKKAHLEVQEEKKFKCEICKKAFWDVTRLKRHLLTHSGEKGYKCRFCGKTFSPRSSYRTHVRIHTGKKTYYCTQCDKAFSGDSCFKRHLKQKSHQELENLCF